MINLGIIGTSVISDFFVTGAKKHMNINAVYSRNMEKAEDFAIKHNIPNKFIDMIAMAESNLIDAVYIASPNALHFGQAKLFLEKGKHVICEKPITLTGKEAEELFELAEKNNLIFMEALIIMHLESIRTLEDSIKKIGKVFLAKFDFCQLSSKYAALKNGECPNIFNTKLGTGSLMDLGIYCVYPTLHLFGTPEKITSSAVFANTGADLLGTTIFEYEDKQVLLTYLKAGQSSGYSEILGDNGSILIEGISSAKKITINYKDGTSEVFENNEGKADIMSYEAKSFVEFINNNDLERHEYLKKLAIEASHTLEHIRSLCGIEFK